MERHVKERWIHVHLILVKMEQHAPPMEITRNTLAHVQLVIRELDARLILMNVPQLCHAETEQLVSTTMEAIHVNASEDLKEGTA